MSVARQAHLDEFCRLLNAIAASEGGPRRLAECTGRDGWPRSGVYFFFEDGETEKTAPARSHASALTRSGPPAPPGCGAYRVPGLGHRSWPGLLCDPLMLVDETAEDGTALDALAR
jgi:hypothetical protein